VLLLSAAVPATAASAADCVILLHGLLRTSHSMTKIDQAFSERGYRVVNVDYPSRQYPIEELAQIAVPKCLAACQATEGGRVHFVTHSLGGILVRYYLSHHSLPTLGRVVMLAPPNQGSEVVDKFGWVPGFGLITGPAGAQLGTDRNSIPLSLGPVTYPAGVIAGTRSVNLVLSGVLPNPDDGKVSVERTKVAGMTDFIEIPASQPFIVRNGAVIEQALAFIETGKFSRRAPELGASSERQDQGGGPPVASGASLRPR
jgi:pimeloyl-ACP methyl ester carboxylesterase